MWDVFPSYIDVAWIMDGIPCWAWGESSTPPPVSCHHSQQKKNNLKKNHQWSGATSVVGKTWKLSQPLCTNLQKLEFSAFNREVWHHIHVSPGSDVILLLIAFPHVYAPRVSGWFVLYTRCHKMCVCVYERKREREGAYSDLKQLLTVDDSIDCTLLLPSTGCNNYIFLILAVGKRGSFSKLWSINSFS